MAADTGPISPARFAAALEGLPPDVLRLKALELCNSVAHLRYSNDQLRSFARGSPAAVPNPVCVDAIRENEAVIDRMTERVALVHAEADRRGLAWAGSPGLDAADDDAPETRRHAAWSDGTFQTGLIRAGRVHVDAPPAAWAGGGLSNEQLRRAVEEQLRSLGHDDDGDSSLHL